MKEISVFLVLSFVVLGGGLFCDCKGQPAQSASSWSQQRLLACGMVNLGEYRGDVYEQLVNGHPPAPALPPQRAHVDPLNLVAARRQAPVPPVPVVHALPQHRPAPQGAGFQLFTAEVIDIAPQPEPAAAPAPAPAAAPAPYEEEEEEC
jgi:hypothetical protein